MFPLFPQKPPPTAPSEDKSVDASEALEPVKESAGYLWYKDREATAARKVNEHIIALNQLGVPLGNIVVEYSSDTGTDELEQLIRDTTISGILSFSIDTIPFRQNQRRVIGAALSVAGKTFELANEVPRMYGDYWCKYEGKKIVALARQGKTITEITLHLERQESSVIQLIAKMCEVYEPGWLDVTNTELDLGAVQERFNGLSNNEQFLEWFSENIYHRDRTNNLPDENR